MSSAARRVRTIAKKELVEFVRDWRTIVAILVIPLLMFPILFILFPLLLASEAAELDAVVVDLVVQSDDVPEELVGLLENASLTPMYESLPDVETLSEPNDDQDRLRNGSVDAILRLRTNGTVLEYAVLYLSTSEQSLEARSRAFDALGSWEENETVRRIDAAGLDANETLDPLRWSGDVGQSDAATQGEQAGMALSLFILVLAVWTFSSAIQPSIDMTAGERERIGTLEALLGLPCSRMELLMGKWLAVATITGAGVLLQIAGLLFAIGFLASSDLISTPSVSLTALVFLCLAVLLFAVMVVAFELALAMRSHSVKEAGSILGPAVLIILFPALFTQVINLDGIETFWFAIPVVNVLLALRELLMNRVVYLHVAVWLVSSTIYAVAAAYYAARQFKREDIVTEFILGTECDKRLSDNVNNQVNLFRCDVEVRRKPESVLTTVNHTLQATPAAPRFNGFHANHWKLCWLNSALHSKPVPCTFVITWGNSCCSFVNFSTNSCPRSRMFSRSAGVIPSSTATAVSSARVGGHRVAVDADSYRSERALVHAENRRGYCPAFMAFDHVPSRGLPNPQTLRNPPQRGPLAAHMCLLGWNPPTTCCHAPA